MIATPPAIAPRPMGCLNSAQCLLDRSADGIAWLIDEGKLVAFNIAHPKARKKCLRILTASIQHYQETGRAFERGWPEIFRLIIKHELLFVRCQEIGRVLNCDPKQTAALVSAGCFTVAKASRRGRTGGGIVTRASFEQWLFNRMEGEAP
jgi:hypothetical protein